MIEDNYNDSGQTVDKSQHVTRLYVLLSLISVVIMVIAAYITHGYQKREMLVSYAAEEERIEETVNKKSKGNALGIGVDLSRVPSDDVIEDIFNDVVPNKCDDCDDKTLDCLEEYEINKIFVQHEGYQDQLILELITGKNDAIYRVVIDLKNNNTVLSSDGKIDEKMCFVGGEEEAVDPEVLISPGVDPINSHYLDVPPPQEE